MLLSFHPWISDYIGSSSWVLHASLGIVGILCAMVCKETASSYLATGFPWTNLRSAKRVEAPATLATPLQRFSHSDIHGSLCIWWEMPSPHLQASGQKVVPPRGEASPAHTQNARMLCSLLYSKCFLVGAAEERAPSHPSNPPLCSCAKVSSTFNLHCAHGLGATHAPLFSYNSSYTPHLSSERIWHSSQRCLC